MIQSFRVAGDRSRSPPRTRAVTAAVVATCLCPQARFGNHLVGCPYRDELYEEFSKRMRARKLEEAAREGRRPGVVVSLQGDAQLTPTATPTGEASGKGNGKGKGRAKGRRSTQEETQDPYPRPEATGRTNTRRSLRGLPQEAWEWLDTVDLCTEWRTFVLTFGKVPYVLTAPLRRALKVPLEVLHRACLNNTADSTEATRAWKLLQLVPRLLLHRAPGGERYTKDELQQRARSFDNGHWDYLLRKAHNTTRGKGPGKELRVTSKY